MHKLVINKQAGSQYLSLFSNSFQCLWPDHAQTSSCLQRRSLCLTTVLPLVQSPLPPAQSDNQTAWEKISLNAFMTSSCGDHSRVAWIRFFKVLLVLVLKVTLEETQHIASTLCSDDRATYCQWLQLFSRQRSNCTTFIRQFTISV